MILDVTCTDSGILAISKVIKSFFYWLQIIGPILVMISLAIHIAKAVTSNDINNIRKYQKNIINSIIAMAMLFFLPYLMDMSMQLIGNKTSFTSCWNSIDNVRLNFGSNYIKTEKEQKAQKDKRTKVYVDSKDYHGKVTSGCLDLTCTSRTVKAQFSCDTLKIVERHLYDLNADNFSSVINSYGGFDKYAKSLGGIFGEYYGKKMPHETDTDFQRACEYVLGWMYMYGWDYKNGFEDNEGVHIGWGGSGQNYSPDAFYYNTKVRWKRKYVPDSGNTTNFDHVISAENTNGNTYAMSSECGDLANFVYNKLGLNVIFRVSDLKKVSLKDVRVGDEILFHNSRGQGHNAVIGEVYSDRIVVYDGSRMVTENKNYKRTVYIPSKSTPESDLAAIRKYVTWSEEWWIRRHHNFKQDSCMKK